LTLELRREGAQLRASKGYREEVGFANRNMKFGNCNVVIAKKRKDG